MHRIMPCHGGHHAGPDGVFYQDLYDRHALTLRVNLAQLYRPEAFRRADGTIDYAGIVSWAQAVRSHYRNNPLIKADAVKIFTDGVLEGNPHADPPDAAGESRHPSLSSAHFGHAPDGSLSIKGYVDTAAPLCADVRADLARYDGANRRPGIEATHGFHPVQRLLSSGKLQRDGAVLMDYARAIHAAVRAAVDAIEHARAADGNAGRPDTIATSSSSRPTISRGSGAIGCSRSTPSAGRRPTRPAT